MNGVSLVSQAPHRQPRIHSVLLANELPLVQEGLVALCDSNPQYEVMGRVFDGAEASHVIEKQLPDIAVVDLRLPLRSGLEIIERVKEADLPTKLIILSTNEDRDMAGACLRAGARAFMLEAASSQEFLEAFRQVAAGGRFVSSELKESLKRHRSTSQDPLSVLTRRELQVLSLLVQGLRVKAIADWLRVSPATVATHRARLMRKLDIHNIAGLVQVVFDRKLLSFATHSSQTQ